MHTIIDKPTPAQIGMPSSRPSAECLAALRRVVALPGVTEVYWFWISVADDPPHLGLAVGGSGSDVTEAVGDAVQPVWQRHEPSRSLFDVFHLDANPDLSHAARQHGELLYAQGQA